MEWKPIENIFEYLFYRHVARTNSEMQMNVSYNSKLAAILLLLFVVVNASMFSVAVGSAELMHGVWVTNVQLVAAAIATYFFLRR